MNSENLNNFYPKNDVFFFISEFNKEHMAISSENSSISLLIAVNKIVGLNIFYRKTIYMILQLIKLLL